MSKKITGLCDIVGSLKRSTGHFAAQGFMNHLPEGMHCSKNQNTSPPSRYDDRHCSGFLKSLDEAKKILQG